MYNIFAATNTENNNICGYVLTKDGNIQEQVIFDKEKTSYADIIKNKINFLETILDKYPEINWKQMLITLVAKDDDLIEFYRTVFYKNDMAEPQVRNKTFDEKITSDEKLYLEVCLKELRNKLDN